MEENAQVPEDLMPKNDLPHSTDSPRHGPTSDRQNHSDPVRKVSRTTGGSDRSVEQSPLHRLQAKGGHGVAPNTPGRLKNRAGGRGDESPDKGPTVPKFGEWDEKDPSSADNFTDIFDKVSKEKQSGSSKVPQITDDSMYVNPYGGSNSDKSSSCCCFSWSKK